MNRYKFTQNPKKGMYRMAIKVRKIIASFLAVMLAAMPLPVNEMGLPVQFGITASAVTSVIAGAFTITSTDALTDDDYSYENNVLTIKSATPVTIANVDPNTPTTTDRIEVEKDVSANITLAGVNIDVSGTLIP